MNGYRFDNKVKFVNWGRQKGGFYDVKFYIS